MTHLLMRAQLLVLSAQTVNTCFNVLENKTYVQNVPDHFYVCIIFLGCSDLDPSGKSHEWHALDGMLPEFCENTQKYKPGKAVLQGKFCRFDIIVFVHETFHSVLACFSFTRVKVPERKRTTTRPHRSQELRRG